MSRLIFDVETDGLLPKLTRVHCLVTLDVDTMEFQRYRRNDEEDTIEEGLQALEEADALIGHNIIGFDLKAIKKVYPDFDPEGEIIDTLIIARTLPVNWNKHDAPLVANKKMPGILAGKQSLDCWGYRVGKHKGTYSDDMKAKGLDPWAVWNQEMEDYCQGDVEVNFIVWRYIDRYSVPKQVLRDEQEIQGVVTYMEQNGYPFLKAEAENLAKEIRQQFNVLVERVSKDVNGKLVPEKKYVVGPIWNDPGRKNAKKTYDRPRTEWGEDRSRAWWADITIPKKTMKSTDPTKRGDRTEGAAYCKVKWREFSPTSRDQVRELLRDRYDWAPTEWTEKGNPKVDDDVLHDLHESFNVPIALDLAGIYMMQKLLGYIESGGEAWIKKYNEDTGCIHPYTNTGGTVTGRCSHAGPNIGQVPSLQVRKVDGKDVVLKGREGRFGFECRSLFYTPRYVYNEPWNQVGVDLSGIEFRMLAEETAEFDDGELIDVVAHSGIDIHEYHMEKTGIDDRGKIKRVTYCLMYGGQDYRLGMQAEPSAPPHEWERIGTRVRAQMMEGLPALDKVMKKYQKESRTGYIQAIDGRKLYCRSEHSSLNTRLQSSGAIVAKRWVCLSERNLMAKGFDHGWAGDFTFLAFVHDELQSGAKSKYAEEVAEIIVKSATEAGHYYNLKCPVDAEYKVGHNWAECH